MNFMHRRLRALIGLTLLVTMSLSLAETVWATVCAPDMANMSAEAMGMMDMPDMPAGDPDIPAHQQDSDEGDESSSCPFSPAGTSQNCASAAVLPAHVVTLNSPFFTDALLPLSDDASPHLLRTALIFHPPKL